MTWLTDIFELKPSFSLFALFIIGLVEVDLILLMVRRLEPVVPPLGYMPVLELLLWVSVIGFVDEAFIL